MPYNSPVHPALVQMMPNPFVKVFARPYVAGSSIQAAIDTGVELWTERRISSTLDLLGEESRDQEQIESAVKLYMAMIDALADEPKLPTEGRVRPSVSLKPSSFTITEREDNGDLSARTDLVRCYENVATIVRHGAQRDVDVTIDMEDHAWVDFTLDSYGKLLDEGLDNVGTVIQSMLFRTKDDIARFDERARVRLVIGIYREPESIAYTKKRDMKKKLVEYAELLLDRGVYLEYATHDEEFLFRFIEEVALNRSLSPDEFEVQMLLGVPRGTAQDELTSGAYFGRADLGNTDAGAREKLKGGVLVRLYVPFATSWDQALAYCKRRLHENPHIMWYGLKNLVSGG